MIMIWQVTNSENKLLAIPSAVSGLRVSCSINEYTENKTNLKIVWGEVGVERVAEDTWVSLESDCSLSAAQRVSAANFTHRMFQPPSDPFTPHCCISN